MRKNDKRYKIRSKAKSHFEQAKKNMNNVKFWYSSTET